MVLERKLNKRVKKKRKEERIAYYKYSCPNGHTRTEKEKLSGEMPFCTQCHMQNSVYVKIKYIGSKKM